MSSAAPTASTARPYRQTLRIIERIILWPFYLTKKESLNFSCGKAVIAWSTQWHADFISLAWRRFCYWKGEIMKRLFGGVVAGCLLGLLLIGGAGAQEPGTRIRVLIPFDFTAKGKTLAAGEYDVTGVMDEPVTL